MPKIKTAGLTEAGYFCDQNQQRWGREQSKIVQDTMRRFEISSRFLNRMVELELIGTKVIDNQVVYPARSQGERQELWLDRLPMVAMLADERQGQIKPYEDEHGQYWIDLASIAKAVHLRHPTKEYTGAYDPERAKQYELQLRRSNPTWDYRRQARILEPYLEACEWLPGRYAGEVIWESHNGIGWYAWENATEWKRRSKIIPQAVATPLVKPEDAADLEAILEEAEAAQ